MVIIYGINFVYRAPKHNTIGWEHAFDVLSVTARKCLWFPEIADYGVLFELYGSVPHRMGLLASPLAVRAAGRAYRRSASSY